MTCLSEKEPGKLTEMSTNLGIELNDRIAAYAKEHELCSSCAYKLFLSGLFGSMALTGYAPHEAIITAQSAMNSVDWEAARRIRSEAPIQ